MDAREPITQHTKLLFLLSLAFAPLGAMITTNTLLLPMNEHTMSTEQLIMGRNARAGETRILFIPVGSSALFANGLRHCAFG